jgi:hypothetical protein
MDLVSWACVQSIYYSMTTGQLLVRSVQPKKIIIYSTLPRTRHLMEVRLGVYNSNATTDPVIVCPATSTRRPPRLHAS